ncbi:unnamed protein product [Caenorhabditis auriculariae]|uniref:Uncharacterized protein n=1 Tax=Caenorhabditis auriculariae TaxID=2777116 RepID=A0A8S1HFX1_9PELO|nr:unnamed protein product [Caenorhabditis auriculariae]
MSLRGIWQQKWDFNYASERYNRLARPTRRANDTIEIEFKLRLDQIVDVHEKDQVLTTKGWLIHSWYDPRLSWKPQDFGNITLMHFPGEMIWLPDVILYNNAHGSPSVFQITQAHVTYDGRTWVPPVVYYSLCNIDIEWYPYDIQNCELKFGSWTFSGTQLSLIHLKTDEAKLEKEDDHSVWKVERGVDLAQYQESVEWDLLSVNGVRHEKWYPCCDYPSIDITYHLQIRRKKLFYTVNMMIPCASLATLTAWVFYLPCESHQKIQLCISILVSLTVYFLMLIEVIPPTSIVTPLILRYLTFTMMMVTLSVGFTVFVQNIHYRTAEYPMSKLIRRVFIDKLGKMLLISRETEMAQFHREAQRKKEINALSAMAILEKQFQKTLFDIEMATKAKRSSGVNSLFLELPMMNRSKSVKINNRKSSVKVIKNRVRRLLSTDAHQGPLLEDKEKTEDTIEKPETMKNSDSVREKLRKAERNVHFIAQTLMKQRRLQEAEADWQFVSLVVDRILLIVFAASIALGTLLTVVTAPSIRDTRPPISPFH